VLFFLCCCCCCCRLALGHKSSHTLSHVRQTQHRTQKLCLLIKTARSLLPHSLTHPPTPTLVPSREQAALFLVLAFAASTLEWAPDMRTRLVVLVGFAVQATRCFGWEAANMWVLEAFPTGVRATAVAVTSAIMRFAAIGTVSASAAAASEAPPARCFAFLSLALSVGLAVAHSLPKETANMPMGEMGT
jgi:hypothetical protein